MCYFNKINELLAKDNANFYQSIILKYDLIKKVEKTSMNKLLHHFANDDELEQNMQIICKESSLFFMVGIKNFFKYSSEF